MTGLEDMTSKQLVDLHNSKCPEDQKLASWKGKKSELLDRIRALGGESVQTVTPKATEETDEAPKATIGASVRVLLQDATLSYADIVDLIHAAHPEANTTARSVASVASVLRKNGTDVPMRRSVKGAN